MKTIGNTFLILLTALAIGLMGGCTKTDDPGNSGNVINNGGGNNGNNEGYGTYNGHEYVDLGLPSRTLWATCNVGASSPEGYGNYYAWGEITPKNTYFWSTYKYCNGACDKLTKYCNMAGYSNYSFMDNLEVLQSSDDAATSNWGSGWRMPTSNEWKELYNNTTNTWKTQNGVAGQLFTASNGRSIFLPAASSHWGGSELWGNGGQNGEYWSCSLGSYTPDQAIYLYFNSDNTMTSYDRRDVGKTIRPVRSSK